MKTMSELSMNMGKIVAVQLTWLITLIASFYYAKEHVVTITCVISAIAGIMSGNLWEKTYFERRKLEKIVALARETFEWKTDSPDVRIGDIQSDMMDPGLASSFAHGDDVIHNLVTYGLTASVIADCKKMHRKISAMEPTQIRYIPGSKGVWVYLMYEFKYHRVFFFLVSKPR